MSIVIGAACATAFIAFMVVAAFVLGLVAGAFIALADHWKE